MLTVIRDIVHEALQGISSLYLSQDGALAFTVGAGIGPGEGLAFDKIETLAFNVHPATLALS